MLCCSVVISGFLLNCSKRHVTNLICYILLHTHKKRTNGLKNVLLFFRKLKWFEIVCLVEFITQEYGAQQMFEVEN